MKNLRPQILHENAKCISVIGISPISSTKPNPPVHLAHRVISYTSSKAKTLRLSSIRRTPIALHKPPITRASGTLRLSLIILLFPQPGYGCIRTSRLIRRSSTSRGSRCRSASSSSAQASYTSSLPRALVPAYPR